MNKSIISRGVQLVGLAMISIGLLLPMGSILARVCEAELWHPEAPDAIALGLRLWRGAVVLVGLSLFLHRWTWNLLWRRDPEHAIAAADWNSDARGTPPLPASPRRGERWLLKDSSPRWAIIVVFAVTAVVIGSAADRFPSYDELVTLDRFVDESVLEIAGYHNSTNNHIINTIAVKIAKNLGFQSLPFLRWASILTGIGIVAAVLMIMRRHFSYGICIASSLISGLLIQTIRYATEARGYVPGAFFYFIFVFLIARSSSEQRRQDLLLASLCALLSVLSNFLYGFFVVLSWFGLLLFELLVSPRRERHLGRVLWGGLATASALLLGLSHLLPSFLLLTLPRAGTARAEREANLDELIGLSIPGLPEELAVLVACLSLLGFFWLLRQRIRLGLILGAPWFAVLAVASLTDLPREARFVFPLAYITLVGVFAFVAQCASIMRFGPRIASVVIAFLTIVVLLLNVSQYQALGDDVHGMKRTVEAVQAATKAHPGIRIGAFGEQASLIKTLIPEVRLIESIEEVQSLRSVPPNGLLLSYDLLSPEDEEVREVFRNFVRCAAPSDQIVHCERGRRGLAFILWSRETPCLIK